MVEDDWKQIENVKLPYHKGLFVEIKKDMNKNKVNVKCDDEKCAFIKKGEKFMFDPIKIHLYSEEAEKGIFDMVDLDRLNNATLLYNLKQRYCASDPKLIYTYATPTLLSINPYERLKYLEDPEFIKKYLKVVI